MKPSIAILVINYNGQHFLEGCFSTLRTLTAAYGGTTDMYLLDNGSSDTSVAYVEKHFPEVSTMVFEKNVGFSGAYNAAHRRLQQQGIAYSYYWILNNDTECRDPEALNRLATILTDCPAVGILAPTVLNADGTIQIQGGRTLFFSGTTLGNKNGKRFHPHNTILRAPWVSGSSLLIRAGLFGALGGFDDYFMYQEDLSLCWNAWNQGWMVAADCGSAIVHFGGGTEKSTTFAHYFSERNRVLVYWQNLTLLSFCLFFPAFLLARLLTLFLAGSPSIAWAKVRGLFSGVRLVSRFPRHPHSLRKDWEMIRLFHQPLKPLS